MSMHSQHNYFKEFPNQVFIETGSYRGDGIQLALDAGFEKIYSVDNNHDNLDFCVSRFDLNNISLPIFLHYGNSSEILERLLKRIENPCTFWLDAHSMLQEDTEDDYPLLAELKVIAKHNIKNHVILIDDFLYLSHPDITGWGKKNIEAALYKINPDYKIEYRSNPIKNNILIAYL